MKCQKILHVFVFEMCATRLYKTKKGIYWCFVLYIY